jgi:hypothetical protein
MAVEVIGMNNIEVYPKLGTSDYFKKSIINFNLGVDSVRKGS